MNTQTANALKMAIEALEHAELVFYITKDDGSKVSIYAETINACKEALKPHPDCDEACMYQCEHERKHKTLEQPAQENCAHIGMDKCPHEGVCQYCKQPEQSACEECIGFNKQLMAENDSLRNVIQQLENESKFFDEQPAQEPVSLGDFDNMSKAECVDYIEYLRKEIDLLRFKEWQGLTNDEIYKCQHPEYPDTMYFARAIEQALKEKNHG
jgi:hypothetical protein